MASTNKTTNYELSQYVGSDKPTYLTDYNQDMSKIDAGIHAAKSEADTNATSIGDLTSLTTTAKTSLVAAANEIDADVATNTNNIATNTSNIATNTTHIGTLSNLTTTAKTDLVVASNEINAKIGNIANLETDTKTSTVAAINEIATYLNLNDISTVKAYKDSSYTTELRTITVAKNSDGSLAKIYGYVGNFAPSANGDQTAYIQDIGLRPDSQLTISYSGFSYGHNLNVSNRPATIVINTDGSATITAYADNSTTNFYIQLIPCLLFIKDFGDVPVPTP